MGLISFIKDAGEKLFGTHLTPESKAENPVASANAEASKAILNYIHKMDLDADELQVDFDGATGKVTVSGTAATQEIKEKILLCCGNIHGVSEVVDNLKVTTAETAPVFYTVVRGDTLSKIAKQHYGDANAYMKIFEANKPMLTHPDKIYPGQTLRIPQ
ncbi:peptidoglycan-binding protein LysM [Methylobacillus flagellatus]|uniref:Potassium binding protein Kbp n=1 Tax=Methylobacillus flagellatus (strain ATCC 51484 / DSM 6875 / VKM B-1610 / KT) TaxID=265072 RepID=Q1GXV7_METFK|nr:peptidoglycan-binding protein LysM [Methylobacillus flagellatus]ABE50930.1 Peptidoglycan-binding LysM [Methylobacillus flagellatus KT]